MGTDAFEAAQKHCAEALKKTYDKYVASLKERISGLNKCNKRWRSLNRQLLCRRAKISCIHLLKNSNRAWCSPEKKFNLLAKTFEKKYDLSDPVEDQFDCAFPPISKDSLLFE